LKCKLSLTDTSSQVLMNFFIEVSYFPFEYYDVRCEKKYTKKNDKNLKTIFIKDNLIK